MLDIVIATKNRDSMLMTALTSVCSTFDACRFHIAYGNKDFLVEYWQKELVQYFKTKGFEFNFIDNSEGNLGTAITHFFSMPELKGKLVLKMDDDFVCEKGAIQRMLKLITDDDTVGAVSLCHPDTSFEEKSVSSIPEGEMFNHDNIWRQDYPWDEDVVFLTENIGGLYLIRNTIDFGTIPDFGEDRFMISRIRDAGYKALVATRPYFWHLGAKQSNFQHIYDTLPPKTEI